MQTATSHAAFAAPELEAELLGMAMLDEKACAQVVGLLRAEHLTGRGHARTFEAVERLFSEGAAVNASSVSEAGGGDFARLVEMTAAVGSAANAERFARIVVERWVAREADRAIRRAAGQLRAGEDVFGTLDELQRSVSDFALGRGSNTHIRYAAASALQRVEEWQQGEATDYAPTGFYSLDRTIGGYPVGELTTLAAMTGGGKTSIIVQIIRTLALVERGRQEAKRRAVLLFSCEMNAEQIAHRAAAGSAGVNLRGLRYGEASASEYAAYSEALRAIGELPLHVDDEPAPSFQYIAARCQMVAQTDGLAFVGVDYDEKIHSEGETEELRVSAIAQGLKNLAKRFEVPVVALSQYSRKANAKQLPDDSWLRYSGKKEHESAVILHWFHPAYWVERGAPPGSVLGYDPAHPARGWLLCTKNRFGPTGKVALDFEPQFTRFVDPGDPDQGRPWWKRLR